jgi:hypothetical protein
MRYVKMGAMDKMMEFMMSRISLRYDKLG